MNDSHTSMSQIIELFDENEVSIDSPGEPSPFIHEYMEQCVFISIG